MHGRYVTSINVTEFSSSAMSSVMVEGVVCPLIPNTILGKNLFSVVVRGSSYRTMDWALVTNSYLHSIPIHTYTYLHPPSLFISHFISIPLCSPTFPPSLSPSLSLSLSLSFSLSLSPLPPLFSPPLLFPFPLSSRPTLGCSVWQSTPTGCCPSTLQRWSRCTVERGKQKCLLTSSPSQTTPTETCCRVRDDRGRC